MDGLTGRTNIEISVGTNRSLTLYVRRGLRIINQLNINREVECDRLSMRSSGVRRQLDVERLAVLSYLFIYLFIYYYV